MCFEFRTNLFFGIAALLSACSSPTTAPLLSDQFAGSSVDTKLWFIPTRNPAGDGNFVGRTRFRATQDSGLPPVVDGNVCMTLQSYSPGQVAFYGTQLTSKQELSVGAGLDITVRARMKPPSHPGIVGGIFLYSLKPGSDTLHDEIDFELLTNDPGRVQANIYGNEPLGDGHVEMIPYASGGIAEDHVYEIQWTPTRVTWLLDGKLVRTVTSDIPTRPMNFYLNIWAPDKYWPQGFSNAIQPVKTVTENETLAALCVSSVTIKPLKLTKPQP